jgi:beta-galactosidase
MPATYRIPRRLTVEVPVQNERATAANVEVDVEMRGQDGKTVAQMKDTAQVAAAGKSDLKLAAAIANPQLWEPAYPYLYTVAITLHAGIQTVDSQEISYGIRSARWDVNAGLFLNSHHLKLHGWGRSPPTNGPVSAPPFRIGCAS